MIRETDRKSGAGSYPARRFVTGAWGFYISCRSGAAMWGSAVRCQFLRRTSLRRRHQFFVTFYVRRLPHWQPPDADIFVTWRLYGSLPRYSARLVPASAPHGKAFVALDRQLDTADSGPLWMKNQEVAAGVSRILLAGVSPWQLYELLGGHGQPRPCSPPAAGVPSEGSDERQECQCACGQRHSGADRSTLLTR